MMDFDDVLLFTNSEYWTCYIELIFDGFLYGGCNVFVFPSLVLVGGVLASFDGPGGFRTVMEALIDGFVAVEEGVALFLRLSLFAVLVVGIFFFVVFHLLILHCTLLRRLFL